MFYLSTTSAFSRWRATSLVLLAVTLLRPALFNLTSTNFLTNTRLASPILHNIPFLFTILIISYIVLSAICLGWKKKSWRKTKSAGMDLIEGNRKSSRLIPILWRLLYHPHLFLHGCFSLYGSTFRERAWEGEYDERRKTTMIII